jgi:hypothetical protein
MQADHEQEIYQDLGVLGRARQLVAASPCTRTSSHLSRTDEMKRAVRAGCRSLSLALKMPALQLIREPDIEMLRRATCHRMLAGSSELIAAE